MIKLLLSCIALLAIYALYTTSNGVKSGAVLSYVDGNYVCQKVQLVIE